MRKLTACIALLLILSLCSSAFAEGIQMIGGGNTSSVVENDVDLDNMKVNKTAKIEGFGEVTIIEAGWSDSLMYTNSYGNAYSWNSGAEADYLFLNVRILNTQKEAKEFLAEFGDVICDYGDGYQFKGWIRQFKKDTDKAHVFEKDTEKYEISPLYAGRYLVVVTLPNIVKESEKEPLSVTFKLGDNDFTYIFRE